ncbi:MAG: hypothetical protein HFG71_05195 [Hungatella sp.]|jgi:hypothetical protein|nr:hypothetical protein [Hungatella sp.]
MKDLFCMNIEGISVKIPFSIKQLLGLIIDYRENKHVRLEMSASVEQQQWMDITSHNWSDTEIVILKEEGMPIFNGIIENLVFYVEGQVLKIKVFGISASVKLDRRKKRRSFQNPSLTYKQLTNKVIEEYEKASFIWQSEEDKEIGGPIFQYDETDWEFLIRLCSHYHDIIVADAKTGNINFFFGLREGERQELDKLEITEIGISDVYYMNGCYEENVSRVNTLYFTAASKESFRLGDFFIINGYRYEIYRMQLVLEKGEIHFRYQLGVKRIYYQKRINNEAIRGIRLGGIIKEVMYEKVRIQLDIDEKECCDYLWPWKPETNSLCYCMPEVGEHAILYLPTTEGVDGIGVACLRQDNSSNVYTDYQKRELVTALNKRIGLYSGKLFLEGWEGKLISSLEDETGIQMCSDKDISFIADGKIVFSGRKIVVDTPIDLTCSTSKSNIEICRDFNFYAPDGVKTQGTGLNVDVARERNEKAIKEKAEQWRLSFSALAAVPSVDFGKGEKNSVIDLVANGAIPKVANGATVVTLKEVMEGKKESETSFPETLNSMEKYSVKGGYRIPMNL